MHEAGQLASTSKNATSQAGKCNSLLGHFCGRFDVAVAGADRVLVLQRRQPKTAPTTHTHMQTVPPQVNPLSSRSRERACMSLAAGTGLRPAAATASSLGPTKAISSKVRTPQEPSRTPAPAAASAEEKLSRRKRPAARTDEGGAGGKTGAGRDEGGGEAEVAGNGAGVGDAAKGAAH